MAYSDIENRYLNALSELQFPTATSREMAAEQPSLDGVQLATGPSSTRTDAPAGAGMGEIKPIPRNPLQEVIGKLGDAIQSGAEKIDFDVIGLPGVGSLTLKDLTVGDIGKVLQDISYGFYPVRGGNEATGGIGTFGLKPDPAMELLNAAPAVGAAGKAAVKGTKAAGKALAPTAGKMAEDYLRKTGGLMDVAPPGPRVDSIERFPVGPSSIKPRVIAPDVPLHREMSPDNLADFLRQDNQFAYMPAFVTDNADLAIGQGANKGIKVQFRANSVSGEEHRKPMTGNIAGREYKADVFAPKAIETIEFASESDLKKVGSFAARVLKTEFDRVSDGKNNVVFVRKAQLQENK